MRRDEARGARVGFGAASTVAFSVKSRLHVDK
jgi:hypothetical protein